MIRWPLLDLRLEFLVFEGPLTRSPEIYCISASTCACSTSSGPSAFFSSMARCLLLILYKMIKDCLRRFWSPCVPHSARMRSYKYFSRVVKYLSNFLLMFSSIYPSSLFALWSHKKLHWEMISPSLSKSLMTLCALSDGLRSRLEDCEWDPTRSRFAALGFWLRLRRLPRASCEPLCSILPLARSPRLYDALLLLLLLLWYRLFFISGSFSCFGVSCGGALLYNN